MLSSDWPNHQPVGKNHKLMLTNNNLNVLMYQSFFRFHPFDISVHILPLNLSAPDLLIFPDPILRHNSILIVKPPIRNGLDRITLSGIKNIFLFIKKLLPMVMLDVESIFFRNTTRAAVYGSYYIRRAAAIIPAFPNQSHLPAGASGQPSQIFITLIDFSEPRLMGLLQQSLPFSVLEIVVKLSEV